MRTVEVKERRARLARRHCLATGHGAATAVEATDRLVFLHGTDPGTIFLSVWARVDGFDRAELERAMYDDRTLVKHMAMRRTIWVIPRRLLDTVQASASARVATQEYGRLSREVQKAGLFDDGEAWLDGAIQDVVDHLAGGVEATTAQLKKALPSLQGATHHGEDKAWGGAVSIGPRVVTVASAQGRIMRAHNELAWHQSRHRWTSTASWLGDELQPLPADEAETRLVAEYLRAFGPATEVDVKWWLGSTLGGVRKALVALEAVKVALDGDKVGYLLPDDLEVEDDVEPWGALLPPLDPTIMGWFEREWYLGDLKARLFDRNGNAGPSMWWDGRVVGGWRQRDDGEVELQPLEDLGADARAVFDDQAARLTDWLGGVRPIQRFPSPLSKEIAETTGEA